MEEKKYKRGYTTGVYDMFHVGHLNVLRRAKEQCEFLIVGVSTDSLVESAKHKKTVISEWDRMEIVKSVRYVDQVIPQTSYDIDGKIRAVTEHQIDVVFVGSDWKGTEKWNRIEAELARLGCDVVYLPHTDGISSTILREKLNEVNN